MAGSGFDLGLRRPASFFQGRPSPALFSMLPAHGHTEAPPKLSGRHGYPLLIGQALSNAISLLSNGRRMPALPPYSGHGMIEDVIIRKSDREGQGAGSFDGRTTAVCCLLASALDTMIDLAQFVLRKQFAHDWHSDQARDPG